MARPKCSLYTHLKLLCANALSINLPPLRKIEHTHFEVMKSLSQRNSIYFMSETVQMGPNRFRRTNAETGSEREKGRLEHGSRM